MRLLILILLPCLLNAQIYVNKNRQNTLQKGRNGTTIHNTSEYNKILDPYVFRSFAPDTIPLQAGDSVTIYNTSLFFTGYGFSDLATYVWTSSIGEVIEGGYRFHGSNGSHSVQCIVYLFGKPKDTVNFVVTIKAKQTVTASMLAIGDSFTQLGWSTQFPEINNRLDGSLTAIGSKGIDPNKHYGVGGKTIFYFTSSGQQMWNGNYSSMNYYITNEGLSNPDIVRIYLGINSARSGTSVASQFERWKTLVDTIHSEYPNTLIIISLTTSYATYSSNWWGTQEVTADQYMDIIWELRDSLYSHYGNGAISNKIQISYDWLAVDRLNDYDASDVIHPESSGYKNIGRAVANTVNYYW